MKTSSAQCQQMIEMILDRIEAIIPKRENRKLDFKSTWEYIVAVNLLNNGDVYFNRECVVMTESAFCNEARSYNISMEEYRAFVVQHHKIELMQRKD